MTKVGRKMAVVDSLAVRDQHRPGFLKKATILGPFKQH